MNVEVTIEATYPLSGTLTLPSEGNTRFPAVLILAGSGKADRDGNLKKMKMNLYKGLAEFLTAQGFATLRYDKRGTYRSKGNFLETGISDFINDAAACVKFLQTHPNIDQEKILILGHSEGALLAPAVVKQIPIVSGLILLAGAAEASKELMPRQNEMSYAELEQIKGFKGWLIKSLKVTEKARRKNEKVFTKVSDSTKDVMRVQGVQFPAKWLRETLEYNVCDYLQEVTCPILAITGEKDLQVPPEHAQKIAQIVKGEAEYHIIPHMNHMLRKYEGTHTMLGLIKEYKTQLNQPIDHELFATIGGWLEKYK